MVTDGILGAVSLLIENSFEPEQNKGMGIVWEMLSGFDEDKWYEMTDEEKEAWVKQYLPKESVREENVVETTEILERISSNNIISAGVIKDTFYTIDKLDDYFSVYIIDILPENFEPETISKFLEEHETDGGSFSGDYKDVIRKLNELKEEKLKNTDFETPINIQKLREYLVEEMILEFESPEECMKYFNTYDYQNFKTVEEMKQYQAEYGFGVGAKWYHINVEEALDVRMINFDETMNLYVYKNKEDIWECCFNKRDDALLFVQEKEYPVELYYTKLDLNGSSNLEREVLENRNDLLEAMQWHGQCNHVIEQIWDFDINSCDKRLFEFFKEVYDKAMHNIEIALSCDDIDEKEISSLDNKIQDAAKTSKKNISVLKTMNVCPELSSKEKEK